MTTNPEQDERIQVDPGWIIQTLTSQRDIAMNQWLEWQSVARSLMYQIETLSAQVASLDAQVEQSQVPRSDAQSASFQADAGGSVQPTP